MENKTKIAIFILCSLTFSFATFLLSNQEKIETKYIGYTTLNIKDVLQPLETKCDDVEPQTIFINNQPYTKATPNHLMPCSLGGNR